MGDEAFFGTINQAVLAENAYKGAQVGIPYNFKAVILMRNKSIIAEAATDFDDLYTKAMAATTDDIYGALLEIGGFYSYAHIYGQGGELMAEDGTPLFNTPEGVAWLEMVMKFYELGADAWYTDNDVTLFKEGKVGWIIDGTWNITPALEYLGDDFVIDPWPAGMAGFVQAKYVYLNANTTGDIAAAAKDFMKFMVSVEAQTMFADIDSGFLPVTAGVEVADAIRQQAIAAAEGGVPFTATNPAFGVYWGPLDTALQSVVAGTATPEEALQTAEESILAAQEE
jgi:maltose-binding protein MalE